MYYIKQTFYNSGRIRIEAPQYHKDVNCNKVIPFYDKEDYYTVYPTMQEANKVYDIIKNVIEQKG